MSVNATFFLSTTEDKCVYNGASIDASGLTTNGNLCAYVEGMNRVWACSAPDRVCWSWDQACKGGDATTPDDSQNYCSSNGAEWCCSKADECTRTPGQINICWGLWRNPTYNMTDAEALLYNQEHYSALPFGILFCQCRRGVSLGVGKLVVIIIIIIIIIIAFDT
ncbi:putative conserved hypothetical protein [Diplodia seriata]|uniref:Uncharacterized protein n=1 Tax=Diplodia seriata TaxID=420778 RepID=A0A0G2DZC0_9PEZI|nr:putative conserved hypothetical protein [Diplodia seriata]